MGGVKNSTTAQRVTAHGVDVAPRPRIRQARVDSISPSLDPSDWAWTVFTNHNDRPLTWSSLSRSLDVTTALLEGDDTDADGAKRVVCLLVHRRRSPDRPTFRATISC